MNLIVSVGQFAVVPGAPEDNLARVRSLTAEAAQRGSDLVVFPELWDSGYALDRAAELVSVRGAGRFAALAELARQHQITIAGSILEAAPGAEGGDTRTFNTAAWFGPDGDLLGAYRKIHLFTLMDEPDFLHPGDAPLLLDLPWGRTATAICYDLRFPELFRRYALDGAHLTVIPAQWPHPRMAHWSTLLRARAIENQMAVVACNRCGADGNVRFGGRSVILDAWGEPVAEAGEDEILLTAELNLAAVARVRAHIPVFEDRRPGVY